MSRRRRLVQLLLVGVLLGVGSFAGSQADARPGGGHSFSGGGGGGRVGGGGSVSFRSGGGSYGGGGGSASFGSFELLVCLVGGFAWVVGAAIRSMNPERSYDSHDGLEPEEEDIPTFPARLEWGALWARDPKFSLIVFQDFVYQLYASVHHAVGDAEALAALAPYVSVEAREVIASRTPIAAYITNVVIGSMQVTALQLDPQVTRISLRFESNISSEHACAYMVEEWQLERAAQAQSKPPEQARALSCPNCGAPFESTAEQRCDHCGEIVEPGRFDWCVTGVRLREMQWRPPPLGGYVGEVGTELPTLVSPSFAASWASLLADDPKLEQQAVLARIHVVYDRLNTAWVARDLTLVRAYISDGLHDYLRYWVEAYQRQGLVNCMDEAQIVRIELVKLQRDAWFDALTVRLFARGLDYTIRELDDRVIGGSTTQSRFYSEYWTLIRGADVRGEARSDLGCPNCGAPLTINMAGNCDHCSAHVTRGEFDWVLSRIEQDESYVG
jgi:hypothetical protein